MDQSLKVLGDFLTENYQDEELVEALRESNDTQSRQLVGYVKDNILLETTLKQLHDLADQIDVNRENNLYTKKQALEEKIKSGSFKYTDALDFAAEVSVIARKKKEVVDTEGMPVIDPETRTQKIENVVEKLKNNIKVIEKMEEPRRTRMAKMFAFQLISALNKRAEKSAKEKGGQTRTIVTQAGKAIVQPTKGKNNSSAVRHEVQRVVKTEGNTVSRELERLDEMMKDEKSAKVYCQVLYQAFMQQYEGAGKAKQFEDAFRAVATREKEIENAVKTKTDFALTPKERIDWNNLNTLVRVKEIKDYAEGKSKLTLSQIKAAVKGLKQSNYDALEIIDTTLGGKEDKAISRESQTKARSGQ